MVYAVQRITLYEADALQITNDGFLILIKDGRPQVVLPPGEWRSVVEGEWVDDDSDDGPPDWFVKEFGPQGVDDAP